MLTTNAPTTPAAHELAIGPTPTGATRRRSPSPPRSRIIAVVATATAAVFALAACSSTPIKDRGAAPSTSGPTTTAAASNEPVPADLVATALTAGSFSELAGLVVDAGLVDTLRGPGPFTVFAPTDAAFAKVPPAVLHAIQDDPEMLKTVLTYHVVAGRLTLADLKPGTIKTVAGADLTVTRAGDTTFINGNPIAAGDVLATNGLVHVMGDVLVPPVGDIVKVATTLPGFTTLTKLVTAAGLVPTLQGAGPFTVFAPIDAAFDKLPSSTLSAVQADPKLLAKVLTYHVVVGRLSTADLKEGKLTTVAGVDLTVTKKDGQTLIDGHPIAVANVQATNGVIQVMGDVLVPG